MARVRATTPTTPTTTPDESVVVTPVAEPMAIPTKDSPDAYVLLFTGLTDTATGIVAVYADGDAKAKAKIRKSVSDLMFAAMGEMDIVRARAYQIIASMLTTSVTKSTEKVDPLLTLANRIATLRMAADLLESGVIVPDGLDVSGVSDTDVIPAGTADSEMAKKIAGNKITRSGVRNDIGEYVGRAFAGVSTGTFLTVAQIITRGAEADNEYRPSSGAVSAALNAVLAGKRTIDGITVETRDALGAVRV